MRNQEQRKEEAIRRLDSLNLNPLFRERFERDGTVFISARKFCHTPTPAQMKVIQDFEEEHKGTVYAVIHDLTEFGELLTMLYVSSSSTEWEADRKDLKDGYPFAYVANLSTPYFSEFGSVGIEVRAGRLVRTE